MTELLGLPLVFDRQSAIAWAQAVMSDPHVVFLDTETTGLDGNSEVIEIAIVDRAGTVLVDSLVKPAESIPAVATAIHGISDHDVASAPKWADLYPRIASICCDRRVVVYNAEFDFRLVRQSCKRAGLTPVDSRFHCAMQAFTLFHSALVHSGRPRYLSLNSAAKSFLLMIPEHRALGDALTCLGVVRGMADAP
jgi:DNA polymerase III epsilon subunit-like protein